MNISELAKHATDKGAKMTSQRTPICRSVPKAPEHLDVYQTCRSVKQSTVNHPKPSGNHRSRTMFMVVQLVLVGTLCISGFPNALAQSEQQILVTIRNYTFETTQMPLQLHLPTVIHLRNTDDVRHDFSSEVFDGSHTRVEAPNAISYGTGIRGVYIEPGGDIAIRFTIEKPGRYQFKCSIHEDMKGEILLMSAGSA